MGMRDAIRKALVESGVVAEKDVAALVEAVLIQLIRAGWALAHYA